MIAASVCELTGSPVVTAKPDSVMINHEVNTPPILTALLKMQMDQNCTR